jgi:hypothetical protein
MTIVGHRLRVDGEDQHGAGPAGTDPAGGIDIGGRCTWWRRPRCRPVAQIESSVAAVVP